MRTLRQEVGDCINQRPWHCHLALCRIEIRASYGIFAMLADKLLPGTKINKA